MIEIFLLLFLKANTLRFNKYGFIQPENNDETVSSGNQNTLNKKGSSQQIYGANSVQSLTTDKSLSTNGEANGNNNNNSKKNGSGLHFF